MQGSPPAPEGVHQAESTAERYDRNLAELLQELRVAGLGVQVLFGFLLSLPFTTRFGELDHGQRNLYVSTLLLAALATALLVGPVAYHRVTFRQHERGRLLRAANVMAIAGLAAVGLAISGSVVLVLSFVSVGLPPPVVAVVAIAVFGGLWFAFPLASRSEGPEGNGDGSRSGGPTESRPGQDPVDPTTGAFPVAPTADPWNGASPKA